MAERNPLMEMPWGAGTGAAIAMGGWSLLALFGPHPVAALEMLAGVVGYFAVATSIIGALHGRRLRRANALISRLVSLHLDTLQRKHRQLVAVDDYGHRVDKGWLKEINYFTRQVLFTDATPKERRLLGRVPAIELVNRVAAEAERQIADSPTAYTFQFFTGMDPIQYEHFCAERLQAAGWMARATQASGDQGVDVIAEAAGQRLVVQCKLYSQPVGNAAVQEIVAGRIFEEAHHAVVVSNAGFTPSAKQLAAKSDVALLHHDDLEEYGRRLLGSLRPVITG